MVIELIARLVELCRRSAWIVALTALLLTLVAGYYAATHLSIDTDTNHLLSPDLPWRELGDSMESAGWFDANNRRGRIKVGEHDIEVAGVHDSHIGRDRYDDLDRQRRPQR